MIRLTHYFEITHITYTPVQQYICKKISMFILFCRGDINVHIFRVISLENKKEVIITQVVHHLKIAQSLGEPKKNVT